MTRESKVGMVVAGSFLCLLGIVIASKMRRADTPTGAEESTFVEGKKDDKKQVTPPAAPGPFALAPKKDEIRPVAAAEPPSPPAPNPFGPSGREPRPVESGTGGGFQPPALPPGGGLESPPPARLGSTEDEHIKKQLERAQNTVQTPPGAPAPNPNGLPALNIPGNPQLAQAAKDAPPPGVGLPPPPVKGGAAEEKVPPPPGVGLPPPPVKGGAAEEKAPPPGAGAPPPTFGGAGLPDLNKKGAEEKKGSVAPPPTFGGAGLPDQNKKGSVAPPPTGLPEPKGSVSPPPGLPERKTPEPIGVPAPSGGTLKDVPPSIGTPPTVPERKTAPAPNPIAVPKGPERPNVPPIGAPMPELPGAMPMSTGAPKTSGGLPPVRTWAGTPVRLQPGDTNFAALSKRLYGTDRYAAALLAYNREHPLADTALKQDPPRLRSDLPIYAPPAEVLAAKYATLLPEAGMPPVTVGRPRPLGGGLRPAPAPPTADAVQRYTVPAQGQMILEVARTTLGDGNRWPEIYRLNPSLQPQNPIPGGTQLRIPATRRGP